MRGGLRKSCEARSSGGYGELKEKKKLRETTIRGLYRETYFASMAVSSHLEELVTVGIDWINFGVSLESENAR